MIPRVRQGACSRRAPVKLQPCTDGFLSAKVKVGYNLYILKLELAMSLQVRLLKAHYLHPWLHRGTCCFLTLVCSCAPWVKGQLWRFTKNWILPNTGGFLPTSSPLSQLCSEPFCFLCYLLCFLAFSTVLSKFHWSRLPLDSLFSRDNVVYFVCKNRLHVGFFSASRYNTSKWFYDLGCLFQHTITLSKVEALFFSLQESNTFFMSLCYLVIELSTGLISLSS